MDANITAANASIPHVNYNIMRVLELWNGSVFELDLTDPFKDERKILKAECLLLA